MDPEEEMFWAPDGLPLPDINLRMTDVGCSVYSANGMWVKEMENKDSFQGDIILDPDEFEKGWNESKTYASIKVFIWSTARFFISTISISTARIKHHLRNRSKFTGCLGRFLGKICLKKVSAPLIFFEKSVHPLIYFRKKVFTPYFFRKKVFAPLSMVPARLAH